MCDVTATLSDVIDELAAGQWKLEVRGQARDYAIDPLVQMLEFGWPDPNRQRPDDPEPPATTKDPEPPATTKEAPAVVQLAVMIVQWARDSQIDQK